MAAKVGYALDQEVPPFNCKTVDDDVVSEKLGRHVHEPVVLWLDVLIAVGLHMQMHVPPDRLLDGKCALLWRNKTTFTLQNRGQHLAASIKRRSRCSQRMYVAADTGVNEVPKHCVQPETL